MRFVTKIYNNQIMRLDHEITCRPDRRSASRQRRNLAAHLQQEKMKRLNRLIALFFLMLLAALTVVPLAWATPPTWLIATPDETACAGAPIVLDVVKPSAQADWPTTLRLRMVYDGKSLEVGLVADEMVVARSMRRTYRGTLPTYLAGLVRIDLAEAGSNRLALLVTATDPIRQAPASVVTATSLDIQRGVTGDILPPADEPALSVNEPIYFVMGDNDGLNARFQFSFKYRFFDSDSPTVAWFPLLSRLHFGYTQTSLWDLGEDSAPFHDSSYRPSLFWQGAIIGKGLMPDLLRVGVEHESNGKDNVSSRSINTVFVQPVWLAKFSEGRTLICAPKLYGYLDKEENSDIQRYRGYADWNFRYGNEDGWMVGTQLRSGTGGYGSAQLDLSYPLRKAFFARTGGFLHFQLFTGYGESLLDYNLDRGTKMRVGFSIVR